MIPLLLAALAAASTPTPTDLTVQVLGLESTQGPVLCSLYASASGWLKQEGVVATTRATPVDGQATCRFPGVAPGTYGVSFIHDLNGNNDMDSNLLGIPREPWGVSRDAPIRMGPPRWEDAAFPHPGPPVSATAR